MNIRQEAGEETMGDIHVSHRDDIRQSGMVAENKLFNTTFHS